MSQETPTSRHIIWVPSTKPRRPAGSPCDQPAIYPDELLAYALRCSPMQLRELSQRARAATSWRLGSGGRRPSSGVDPMMRTNCTSVPFITGAGWQGLTHVGRRGPRVGHGTLPLLMGILFLKTRSARQPIRRGRLGARDHDSSLLEESTAAIRQERQMHPSSAQRHWPAGRAQAVELSPIRITPLPPWGSDVRMPLHRTYTNHQPPSRPLPHTGPLSPLLSLSNPP